MADNKPMQSDQFASLVLCTKMAQDNPELIGQLLAAHDEQPTIDPEVNCLKLAKLSQERGRFFNEDFGKTAAAAGYYNADNAPHILQQYLSQNGEVQAGNFSLKDLGAKLKTFGQNVGDKLKGIFKKKDTANGDTATALTPMEISDTEEARALQAMLDEQKKKEEEAKKKMKPILGMHPALFFSLVGAILIVIVILIVRAGRQNKKLKEGDAKKT